MTTNHTRGFGIAVVIAFALCETQPALALGPNEALGGRYSVNAMAYFRLPLGPSRAEQHRTRSFGITVKGEFAHPAYEREKGAYVTSANVDLMNFRFGKNGKVSGFDVGGLHASGDKPYSDAGTDRSAITGK
jgi:hypothetical protein